MPKPEYIPINELVAGRAYKVKARNFSIAIWTGGAFAGLRVKFGDRFIDEELHWDTDLHHGTCKPLYMLPGQEDEYTAPVKLPEHRAPPEEPDLGDHY